MLLIVGFIVGGEPPDVDEPVQRRSSSFYVDDKDSIYSRRLHPRGSATVLFIFFANYLRAVFHGTRAAATILVGAAIFAIGGADRLDAYLIAMAEAADNDLAPEYDPDAPGLLGQRLLAVRDRHHRLPSTSVGISILRTAVLPRWLGWIALVIAVVSIAGPIGFFAFPAHRTPGPGAQRDGWSMRATPRERTAGLPLEPPPA